MAIIVPNKIAHSPIRKAWNTEGLTRGIDGVVNRLTKVTVDRSSGDDGSTQSDRHGFTHHPMISVLARAGNAKLLHFRMEGRAFESKFGRSAGRASDHPVRLFQRLRDVLALGRFQGFISRSGSL